MDTNLLEDFLAVLDQGGFSRAAEHRGVTQPAFSRRIQMLEDWIGASLFDRGRHAVRPTAAGERLRPLAEDVLRRLHAGRADVMATAQAASVTLRFASTHALSLTFFPAWLRSLEARVPNVATVQLTADTMVGCERFMVEGRAHFLLCHAHASARTRLTAEAFSSVALGRDVLVPVAAPNVAGAAYLAYSAESGMGRILAAAWAEAGRAEPGPVVFASHLASALAAMARDGRGTSWSPLSLVAADLDEGRLVRAGPASEDVPIEIRLYRSRHRQSPVAEDFWRHVAEAARQNVE